VQIFNSTLVVSGEAYGVVVKTGDHTLIGQIAALTGGEGNSKSPLGTEMCVAVSVLPHAR
jgi:sodium/potassium-transporting ATPase subunit alpha